MYISSSEHSESPAVMDSCQEDGRRSKILWFVPHFKEFYSVSIIKPLHGLQAESEMRTHTYVLSLGATPDDFILARIPHCELFIFFLFPFSSIIFSLTFPSHRALILYFE